MVQLIELKVTGIIDSITAGTIYKGNHSSVTKCDYLILNGQKYGPVIFDDKVGLGLKPGVEMNLCMAKIDEHWYLCSIKHVESGKIFTKTRARVGWNVAYRLTVHSILILLTFCLFLGGGFAIGSGVLGGILGLIAAIWYAKSAIATDLQMKVTIKLAGEFGEDVIL